MIRFRILPAAAVIIMFCAAGFAAAEPVTEVIDYDGIRYTVVSEKGGSLQEADLLHKVFYPASEQLYAEYAVKKPAFFNVTILCGASLFSHYTGQGINTAGLFIAEREIFVFQRPSALKKKDIMKNTVYHELLHSAVYYAMPEDMRNLHPRGDAVINEAFCTALYAAGVYDHSAGEKMIAEYNGDEQKIKKYLADALFSKNTITQKKRASAAYAWGLSLIKKYGSKRVFLKASLQE